MNKKNIGIRDIAKIAGVSISTVSRVTNNSPNISDDVRKKVQAVIDEYNYVPNISAANLFSNNSKSIALFVLDIYNPFFLSLVKALNNIAFSNGYTLLICDTESNQEKENEYLKYCRGIRTKGIIFTEGHSENIYDYPHSGQNYVFHDRSVSPVYSSVKSDNVKGITMAVDYLYNLNHRNFAFVGGKSNIISSVERKNAFVSALEAKGIIVSEENIFDGDMTVKTGIDALDYFCSLPQRPTAIVCCNDQIAKGFILRANHMNLKVPDDFSVIGFDGCVDEVFYPQLTTIKQDVYRIAEKLFELAVTEDALPEQYVSDVSFVIGNSCSNLIR